MKNKTLKTALCISTLALMLAMPSTVKGAGSGPEEGIAGIALSLNQYRNLSQQADQFVDQDQEVYKAEKALSEYLKMEVLYQYKNLGISTVDNYINIRNQADGEAEVGGKLYRGMAVDILDKEGDWLKIESGQVKGYVKAEFLAIGKETEEYLNEFSTRVARVKADLLRVRSDQTTESQILGMLAGDESVVVVNEYEEWLEVLVDIDGEKRTGFIAKDLVEVSVKFKYAITIEEENRIIAEQEAIRVEEERRLKLAEEEAARVEQARIDAEVEKTKKAEKVARQEREKRQAEQARKVAEEAKLAKEKKAEENKKNEEKSEEKEQPPKEKPSGDAAAKRQKVVNYALKFQGTPYVWGGNNLNSGVDCSGFVKKVYEDMGYNIPHRVSANQARYSGVEVSASNMQPGDLLFYTDNQGSVDHVSMYIGNNQIIHASSGRGRVMVIGVHQMRIHKVRRIIQ